jgi:hypothetical protein
MAIFWIFISVLTYWKGASLEGTVETAGCVGIAGLEPGAATGFSTFGIGLPTVIADAGTSIPPRSALLGAAFVGAGSASFCRCWSRSLCFSFFRFSPINVWI